jgi:hypothetical protein
MKVGSREISQNEEKVFKQIVDQSAIRLQGAIRKFITYLQV